jgi:hypothetical protein
MKEMVVVVVVAMVIMMMVMAMTMRMNPSLVETDQHFPGGSVCSELQSTES